MTATAETRDFDAKEAAGSLRTYAEAAAKQAGVIEELDRESPLVTSAVGLLRDAKEWLALVETPFKEFPGDWLIEAVELGARVSVDFFHTCVADAAITLEQVAKFIELRPTVARRGS